MDLQLKGKTALVTGASSGIGRAIALELAAEGVRLCVSGRQLESLQELAKEIAASGGHQPEICIVDIMLEGSPQTLAEDALKKLGRIDILVNCAGGITHMTLESPEQAWRDVMTLNYTRPRELTMAIVPLMAKQKWGRIINISGSSEPKGVEAGSAPKAAVHGFAKGLSREVAKHGITVNSVSPGPGKINTPMTRRLFSDQARKEFAEREIPVGRFGEPEELAYLVVSLASPRASYITGNVIHVDGGAHRFAFT